MDRPQCSRGSRPWDKSPLAFGQATGGFIWRIVLLVGGIAAGGEGLCQGDSKPEATPVVASEEEAKKAIELYEQMIENKDPAVQRAAIHRLGGVRHRLVAKMLAKRLRTNDEQIQSAAILALSKQDKKVAAGPLLAAFQARPNRERNKIRSAILVALGELGSRKAIKLMIKILRDEEEDPEVVKGAVVALGTLEEPRALDDLIKILEADPNDQPEKPGPRDPPASYWRRLWKRWRVVEAPLHSSIEKITGKRFKDGKEAREFYEKNRRKLLRRKS